MDMHPAVQSILGWVFSYRCKRTDLAGRRTMHKSWIIFTQQCENSMKFTLWRPLLPYG